MPLSPEPTPPSGGRERLFQKAPRNAAEAALYGPLDIPPDQVLEMDEAEWYARVYRGANVPQLTVRAVLVGTLLGFLLAFTNLYVGLMTGWGLGVALTACILSFALWNGFMTLGLARSPMTILETNCMQSTASAAGYATGSTMVSAIPAMLMLGHRIEPLALVLWTLLLGALGTVMAIPMKRNLINRERLRFPSGTAAAATLQALYSHGAVAAKKAKALLWAMAVGGVFPVFIDMQFRRFVAAFHPEALLSAPEKFIEWGRGALLPADSKLFDWLPALGTHTVDGKVEHYKPSDWTMVMDHSPVMIGAGAIIGIRIAFWMLIGNLALNYGLGPEGLTDTWVNAAGATVTAVSKPWKAWKESGIWFGVPIMVTSGLLAFALQWRTIARAFRGFGSGGATDDLVTRTEVPGSWFLGGLVLFGAGITVVGEVWFQIPWYFGILAVAMTFFLALVAARATGETDITPIGAMGKITQLTYGVLIPQSTAANLMTASITANCATSAADLLTDLKSGYLLGANPRRQFAAQFLGIFAGTAAMVGGFYLLVPDATVLTGVGEAAPRFPAPAAQAWKAVAEVFALGFQNMHPSHRMLMLWGGLLGVVLVLLDKFRPKAWRWNLIPSATGVGLGMILPFQYPLSIFIGAAIASLWKRKDPENAETYLIPVAAGVIAGVSIIGVVSAILNNLVFNG